MAFFSRASQKKAIWSKSECLLNLLSCILVSCGKHEMKMGNQVSAGTRFLNGFLSIMVGLLILVLAAVVICMILAAVGVF